MATDHCGKCGTESHRSGLANLQAPQHVSRGYRVFFFHLHICSPAYILSELAKFGPAARAHLFVQLRNFPTHYLVLVVADEDFKHALVSVKSSVENAHTSMVMDDIGWLDVTRIRGSDIRVQPGQMEERWETGSKRKALAGDLAGRTKHETGRSVNVGWIAFPSLTTSSFKLESDVLRELYAYCWYVSSPFSSGGVSNCRNISARVSHTKVEQQLKSRGIPYTNVSPSVSPELTRDVPRGIHSPLASSVPILCVQSKDILSGVPAAEAAMPNIRVVPINWWAERKCQVRYIRIAVCDVHISSVSRW